MSFRTAELMQTELHHLQTLHVMAEVFRRGMKREVQLDVEAVERVFPCLDQLLAFHRAFFGAMKERRLGSAQPPGHRNYLVQRLGDVLLQQVGAGSESQMWKKHSHSVLELKTNSSTRVKVRKYRF